MISRRTLLECCVAPALAAAPADPRIGLAFGTYGMKSLATADALRALASIGYDGVELCCIAGWPADPAKLTASDRGGLRTLIADTGLKLPALQESLPYSPAPAERTRNLDRLRRVLDLANELAPSDPPVIDTVLGGKSAEWDTLRQPLLDTLGEFAALADASKTTVCFKPHAGQAVDNAEKAIWLLERIRSRRIRIIYDYSHFYLAGLDLQSSLRAMLPWTALIVMKDSRRSLDGKPVYLLPGEGETDYPQYFRLLKQLRYSGYVSFEISSQIHSKPGYQPLPTARLCYERLSPLVAKAGIKRAR